MLEAAVPGAVVVMSLRCLAQSHRHPRSEESYDGVNPHEGVLAMSAPLELTLGLNRTPFTEALFTGEVQPDGIHLTCLSDFSQGLDNTGERHRQILAGKLDGGECSTSSFFLARDRGVPLVALPVFPARGFP